MYVRVWFLIVDEVKFLHVNLISMASDRRRADRDVTAIFPARGNPYEDPSCQAGLNEVHVPKVAITSDTSKVYSLERGKGEKVGSILAAFRFANTLLHVPLLSALRSEPNVCRLHPSLPLCITFTLAVCPGQQPRENVIPSYSRTFGL